jgi:hypothetical protein
MTAGVAAVGGGVTSKERTGILNFLNNLNRDREVPVKDNFIFAAASGVARRIPNSDTALMR